MNTEDISLKIEKYKCYISLMKSFRGDGNEYHFLDGHIEYYLNIISVLEHLISDEYEDL